MTNTERGIKKNDDDKKKKKNRYNVENISLEKNAAERKTHTSQRQIQKAQ